MFETDSLASFASFIFRTGITDEIVFHPKKNKEKRYLKKKIIHIFTNVDKKISKGQN